MSGSASTSAAASGAGANTMAPQGSSISAVGADQTLALKALKAMNFDWVTRRDDVWVDDPYDVPHLHEDLRTEFDDALEELVEGKGSRSPLGWFITGSGGRGKTHLLSAFRRSSIQRKAAFVQVDLTDVRNFWDTVLQGIVNSLQQPYEPGRFQYQTLLQNAVAHLGSPLPPQKIVEILHGRKSTNLRQDIEKVLAAFARLRRPKAPPKRHQDVVRALICLNSADHSTSSLGLSWLQGLELEEQERKALDFQAAAAPPREIAEGLSWLMGFAGPTVMAFDQLDPIVTQAERGAAGADDESGVAMSIVRDIGDGLGALCQIFDRTLPVVVCLEQTFAALRKHTLTTSLDRFSPPQILPAIRDGRIAEAVVRCRLAPAFEKSGFVPPYDTWPFAPDVFSAMANLTPREVLQLCDAHRRKCLRAKAAVELTSLSPPETKLDPVHPPESGSGATPDASPLDAKYLAYQKEAEPKLLLEEKEEDQRLAPLLQAVLSCLVQEADLPPSVTASVDADFTGGKKTKPLHARLRLIFHSEQDREEHFSTQALQLTNAVAFISRLKAAITGAGIDRQLNFRRLVVVRTTPRPTGEKSVQLRKEFELKGGIFYELPEAELRALYALQRLREENDAGFLDWLRARRPASRMKLVRVLAPHPLLGTAETAYLQSAPVAPQAKEPLSVHAATKSGGDVAGNGAATTAGAKQPEPPPTEAAGAETDRTSSPTVPQPVPPAEVKVDPPPPFPTHTGGDPAKDSRPSHPRTGFIPFGRKVVGAFAQGEWKLPVLELARHMVVLAGAGSGKSVLLRRIVEEAALEGIPSIVVDCGQDLSTLGEAWPPQHATHRGDDAFKADLYLRSSDVVVWTPGKPSGNPMALELLPDLPAMADAPEELSDAVDMVVESLMPIVAARGGSRAADHKRALLRSTLRFYARHEGGGPEALMAILRALPEEAGLGIDKEEKYAREMADSLASAKETNPLLRNAGAPLDPAVLFGDDPASRGGRTRVSVLSLVGLAGLEAQQTFVNQLAMTLFAWIKRNPLPPGRPLRGLLVIDEAKDFAPSQRACPSRESLVRLVAQARKYRLGVIFATQNPKDLDNKIVSNCSTHCYGKVGSPVAIEAAKELIQQKGGSGDDVARLQKGIFYVHNADSGHGSPMKVQTPLCLSHHRASPPSPEEIVAMAAESRRKLTGR